MYLYCCFSRNLSLPSKKGLEVAKGVYLEGLPEKNVRYTLEQLQKGIRNTLERFQDGVCYTMGLFT